MKQLPYFLLLLLSLTACTLPPSANPSTPLTATTTTKLPPDTQLNLEWMQVFRSLVKNAALNPPAASRVYAYAGIALYESQARSTQQRSTLEGQLNGLTGLNAPPSEALDSQMVVNETLYTLAKGLFPKGVSVNPALLTTFYEQKRARLQSSLEPALFKRSQSYGVQLGQDLVKWSLTDQVQELREKSYLQPSRSGHPEYWQPTESNTTAIEPHWGKMRTFAIATAQTCQESMPLSFSTEAGSAFYPTLSSPRRVQVGN